MTASGKLASSKLRQLVVWPCQLSPAEVAASSAASKLSSCYRFWSGHPPLTAKSSPTASPQRCLQCRTYCGQSLRILGRADHDLVTAASKWLQDRQKKRPCGGRKIGHIRYVHHRLRREGRLQTGKGSVTFLGLVHPYQYISL